MVFPGNVGSFRSRTLIDDHGPILQRP
jgi:hypothetical protein